MHITIIAIGSRGDVQPYVALGLGLQHAGHHVRLATHRQFEAFVLSYGLEFVPVVGNPQEMIRSQRGRIWLESGRNLLRFMLQFWELNRQLIDQYLEDIQETCRGTQVIIYSILGTPGYSVAEKLGIPCFPALLQPLSRTQEFPAFYLPTQLRLGKWFNWFSYMVSEQIYWQVIRHPTNAWRTALGLQPFSFWGPYKRLQQERLPYLYGFSPWVVPRPADWPEWHHITGYWFLEHRSDWHPPEVLLRFLEQGPPPVYVGFGSMAGGDPQATTRIVLKALEMSGQRGVLSQGWAGLGDAELPREVLLVDEVPHDWLFPRMAAVVHHGGAGTTAAGLRAGIPTVIAPYFGDQFFWGQRVQALGVGPAPIPQKRLTSQALAAAIQTAVQDPTMRSQARRLGDRIRQENGVAEAVGLIHHYLGLAQPIGL